MIIKFSMRNNAFRIFENAKDIIYVQGIFTPKTIPLVTETNPKGKATKFYSFFDFSNTVKYRMTSNRVCLFRRPSTRTSS